MYILYVQRSCNIASFNMKWHELNFVDPIKEKLTKSM